MIDLHSHVLPGLDDGCADLAESVELARSLAATGVKVLAATPHVRTDFPTSPLQMQAALDSVRDAVEAAGIEIAIVPGGELAFEQLDLLDLETLHAFSLGGSSRFVLVEFPHLLVPPQFADTIQSLHQAGLTPVIAHPERNPAVQSAPQRLAGLVDAGALIQITAGSLTGAFGRDASFASRNLVESGLAHVLASDAHHPGTRPTIADALQHLPRASGTWLTHDAPGAILAGERPAPPPPYLRRRGLFSR
jgi:protein-tyrosine phosphatase